MADMRCRAARPQLDLFHDAELSVDAQIAVEAHLAQCEPCRERVRGLLEMRRIMREWSPRRAAPRNLFDGLPSAVVSRYQAEEAQTLGSRVGRMFEDMHLVWAGLAGTAAMLCCVAVIFGLSPLSAPSRADSLFGVMRAMSVPAERSSLTRLDWAVRLPRVRTAAALPLVLGVSGTAGREMVFALAAVVTQDGRLSNLQVLLPDDRDRDVLLQFLSAASATRFEPGRIGGAPVAMNLVWLLAHMTVRAVGDIAPEAALRTVRPFSA